MTPEEQLKAQIATQLLCAPLDSAAGIILQRSPHREYVPDALQLADTLLETAQIRRTVPHYPVPPQPS